MSFDSKQFKRLERAGYNRIGARYLAAAETRRELVDALLAAAHLAPGQTVLDLASGPGLLARAARDAVGTAGLVVASDIAEAQLACCPGLARVAADGEALPFADASFDTVLFHQVLHYAQEPEGVLAEAARVTRPGGVVAVVDFAAHDREELRERHAHARLGFSDEQMLALLSNAGFAAAPIVALPGTPLTVKIWAGRKQGGTAAPAPAIHSAIPQP